MTVLVRTSTFCLYHIISVLSSTKEQFPDHFKQLCANLMTTVVFGVFCFVSAPPQAVDHWDNIEMNGGVCMCVRVCTHCSPQLDHLLELLL